MQLLSAAVPQTAVASDTAALEAVLDELEADELLPESLLADALYGSDDNVQHAQERGVELVAPTQEGARQVEEASTRIVPRPLPAFTHGLHARGPLLLLIAR